MDEREIYGAGKTGSGRVGVNLTLQQDLEKRLAQYLARGPEGQSKSGSAFASRMHTDEHGQELGIRLPE